MNKIKLRATVLKGNVNNLKNLAKTYGMTLESFIFMLGSIDWYCLSRDVYMQRKMEGKDIPEHLEFIDRPRVIQISDTNTERLNVYVTPDTDMGLKIKQKQYGFNKLGALFDKICCEEIQFINPDLINEIKSNGGKK